MSRIVFVVFVAIVVAAACVVPSTRLSDARRFVDSMVFIEKDGVCYGVVEFVTYGAYRGVSILVAPLEKCR